MPAETKEEWYADGLSFTCTQCGNCCTGPPGFVWYDEEESKKIADHAGITEDELRTRFSFKFNSHWSLGETKTQYGYDCIFLTRDESGHGTCSIYPVRPHQCRTWPFWPENLKNTRRWKDAATDCPGMAAGVEGKGKFYPIEQIRIIRDNTPEI